MGKIDFDPTSGSELINSFAVYDNYLFVGSYDLIIFDISNPSNPVEVSRLDDFKALQLTIQDDTLFSISSELIPYGFRYSITILDIENPLTPLFLGECVFEEANTYIQSLVVSNSFVYIAS